MASGHSSNGADTGIANEVGKMADMHKEEAGNSSSEVVLAHDQSTTNGLGLGALDRIGAFAGGVASGPHSGAGGVGMSPLLANVAMADSFHCTVSSGDEPSTDSRMCTEESAERMTSSTEGMVSLSEDSSGRDTYAQAHGLCPCNSVSGGTSGSDQGDDPAEVSGCPQPCSDVLELDESDEQMNGLLGSYREISLENDGAENERLRDRSNPHVGEDTEEEVSNLSPDSGPMSPLEMENVKVPLESEEGAACGGDGGPRELNKRPSSLHLTMACGGGARPRTGQQQQLEDFSRRSATDSRRKGVGHTVTTSSSEVPSVPGAALSGSTSAGSTSSSDVDGLLSGLQGLQGLVLREGEMVSFVAEDLQEQIRRASPVIRRGETPSFPGSRSSTPSLYKQALTPQLPPIDPAIINDIEVQARNIASSVDKILENLTGTLHSMSSLTVDCMDVYHDAVCKTCDSVDGNIKAMYQLMAKFEELGNLMRPVYRSSGQIKEIKRLLDLLEHVAASGGS